VSSALYYARRVAGTPFRYQSPDEDSARWLGFPFRDGDIVISTRSKTGTTWAQMICALLIFQTPELPAPLAQLSPWLDHLIVPREEVYAHTGRRRCTPCASTTSLAMTTSSSPQASGLLKRRCRSWSGLHISASY